MIERMRGPASRIPPYLRNPKRVHGEEEERNERREDDDLKDSEKENSGNDPYVEFSGYLDRRSHLRIGCS